jgi:hypothetical protein
MTGRLRDPRGASHDRFGGEILKTSVEDEWHFYDRVAGTVYNREEALTGTIGTIPER